MCVCVMITVTSPNINTNGKEELDRPRRWREDNTEKEEKWLKKTMAKQK